MDCGSVVPIERYELGEEIPFEGDLLMDFTMKGYAIVVNHAELLTYEAFLKKYQAEDEYTIVPEKLYDVSITLKNIGADDSVGVNLTDFYIQKWSIHESVDPNMYEVANPKMDGASAIALRKNTEMEIHLPFSVWREHYKENTWAHLEDHKMDFVATLYPTKKVVILK